MNKKALHYSAAIGALRVLGNWLPDKSRKQTRCTNLAVAMNKIDLGRITADDVERGAQVFRTVRESMNSIADESGMPHDVLLVALVTFHLDELEPLPTSVKTRLSSLLDCWPESSSYAATRAAHRLWQRMDTEITILEVA